MKHLTKHFPWEGPRPPELDIWKSIFDITYARIMQFTFQSEATMTTRQRRPRKNNRQPTAPRSVHIDGVDVPNGEAPDNTFDRIRQSIAECTTEYTKTRDAWQQATAALEKSNPCSTAHPHKVSAAVLTLSNFLGASERLQSCVKRVS